MKKGTKSSSTKKPVRRLLKDNKKTNAKSRTVTVKDDTTKTPSKLKDKAKKVLGSTQKKKKQSQKKKKNAFSLHPDQERDLITYRRAFDLKSTNDLKALLKKNNQPMSGNKKELVDKCAQGKVFGALPSCSKCGGGKLRFNITSGEYKCPGYMEDTDFVFCNFKATAADVTRNAWID